MNEDFVTYELAVKLKERGFNEPCYGYYHRGGGDNSFEVCGNGDCDFLNSKNKHRIATPTISQVLKWMRKEKKIYVSVEVECEDWFEYKIVQLIKNTRRTGTRVYETYDDAMLAGIEYVLDNLI